MGGEIKKILSVQIEQRSENRKKLYRVIQDKINYFESRGELKLYNLLESKRSILFNVDSKQKNKYFVIMYKGYFAPKLPIENIPNQDYKFLCKESLYLEEAYKVASDFIIEKLDSISEKKLMAHFMSPIQGGFKNERSALDTLNFLSYVEGDGNSLWYDLQKDHRKNREYSYSFVPVGCPNPRWDIEIKKVKKIKDYSRLSSWRVYSLYKDRYRSKIWSLLFTYPFDQLPEVIQSYVRDMKIPVNKFERYRGKFQMQKPMLEISN